MIAAIALVLQVAAGIDEPVRAAIARREWSLGLRAAAALPDDAARTRGEVEVRYYAGDLAGAHAAARAGLARHPDDAFLALRHGELSATLRDRVGAHRGAEALERSLRTIPPAATERAAWQERLAARTSEAESLERTWTRSRSALLLAQIVVFVLGCGGLVALLTLALRERSTQRTH